MVTTYDNIQAIADKLAEAGFYTWQVFESTNLDFPHMELDFSTLTTKDCEDLSFQKWGKIFLIPALLFKFIAAKQKLYCINGDVFYNFGGYEYYKHYLSADPNCDGFLAWGFYPRDVKIPKKLIYKTPINQKDIVTKSIWKRENVKNLPSYRCY